jgi:hypothetical protein
MVLQRRLRLLREMLIMDINLLTIIVLVYASYVHVRSEEEKSRENQRQIRAAMDAAYDAASEQLCEAPDRTI